MLDLPMNLGVCARWFPRMLVNVLPAVSSRQGPTFAELMHTMPSISFTSQGLINALPKMASPVRGCFLDSRCHAVVEECTQRCPFNPPAHLRPMSAAATMPEVGCGR